MFDSLNSKQKKIIIIIGIVVILSIVVYIFKSNSIDKSGMNEEILVTSNSTNSVKDIISEDKEKIIIHITGAVKIPGIVKLNEGSRIEDAINKAGGLTETADISKVNLAYVLEDGMKIKIPSNTDIGDLDDNIISSDSGENIVEDVENGENLAQSTSLNINKATEQELQNLPGIGPSLAYKIINYRNENGKFSTVEDIKNVNGIGDSKYENIRDFICVK